MSHPLHQTILELFGIRDAIFEQIGSYKNANYKVAAGDSHFVLKEYSDRSGLADELEAESRIMERMWQKEPEKFQQPRITKEGRYLVPYEKDGISKLFRVVSFLEGDFLAEAEQNESLIKSLGSFLADLDKALLDVNETAIRAKHDYWDLQYFLSNENLTGHIQDPARRKIVEHYFLQYKEQVLPQIEGLRKSTIHNDANDWNVLVDGARISGIIDFGDMAYSPLIHEIVIAMTYVMLDKKDPVKTGTLLLQSYHDRLPLEEKEIDLIYYLIAARMCTSVVLSAEGSQKYPDNDYITISERYMWGLLQHWICISPIHAANTFRKACGFPPSTVASTETLIKRRNRVISKAYALSYNKPVKMTGGLFQYMFDESGKTYLDMRNNIPHVGHNHPRVVSAAQRQMATLNTNTRYLYDELITYSERLLAKFPDQLNKVFFVNSGSAASDLAIRLALAHTGHEHLVVIEHGYHGNTRMGIDISHYKYGGKGGRGKPGHVVQLPLPDTFKGKYRNPKDAGKLYSDDARAQILNCGYAVAALIAEPVVGCGGQVPLATGYLKNLCPVIRQQGGVFISDEVQTGFGRMGTSFWGFELHDVVPDIVILGKPIGNGHPMAAVITTEEITQSLETGMEFFSSFGGNPVSCRIGESVLDVIEEENLMQNAGEVGKHLIHRLNDLKSEYPSIGDVRGSGFYLGIEFIQDPRSMSPDTDLAQSVNEGLKDHFILAGTDGPNENILKLKPPMCFNMENADHFLTIFKTILKSLT